MSQEGPVTWEMWVDVRNVDQKTPFLDWAALSTDSGRFYTPLSPRIDMRRRRASCGCVVGRSLFPVDEARRTRAPDLRGRSAPHDRC